MGSPSAQKDDNTKLEIVCAVIQEVIKENNKQDEKKQPGEYTVVESKGRKDEVEAQIAQSLEQVIQAGAHIGTLPFKVIQSMIKHPLTDAGIKKFLKDWETIKK